jgi:hypothetical protein
MDCVVGNVRKVPATDSCTAANSLMDHLMNARLVCGFNRHANRFGRSVSLTQLPFFSRF